MTHSKHSQWPASTFYFEKETDAEHYPSSHWIPFVDDVQTVFQQLPDYMDNAMVKSGYANFHPSKNMIPKDWARGASLISPDQNQGIMILIKIRGEEGNDIVSIFPFHHKGRQFRLTIEQVIVFENGVEAQIEACLEPAEITFYDSLFLVNREHYQAGKQYEFILTAIAYYVRIASPKTFQIKLDKKVAKHLSHLKYTESEQQEITLSTEGAAIMLPLPDGDKDEYQFSGIITQVEVLDNFFGQTGWWVDVTIMRNEQNHDEPIDYKILITSKAWSDNQPPKMGQEIEGSFWLQGYLFNMC